MLNGAAARRLAAALLLLAGGGGAPGAAATGVLRLSSGGPGGADRALECVGSWVGGGWILTAGHCLPAPPAELRLTCAAGDGASEARPVAAVRRHPTHDLGLMRIAGRSPCGGSVLGLAPAPPPGTALVARRPAGGSSPAGAADLPLAELARDSHVLRLRPRQGCLDRGDSGTPVLAGRAGGPPEVVAVLISGDPDCRAAQTAVRLDRLLPWIRQIEAQ